MCNLSSFFWNTDRKYIDFLLTPRIPAIFQVSQSLVSHCEIETLYLLYFFFFFLTTFLLFYLYQLYTVYGIICTMKKLLNTPFFLICSYRNLRYKFPLFSFQDIQSFYRPTVFFYKICNKVSIRKKDATERLILLLYNVFRVIKI